VPVLDGYLGGQDEGIFVRHVFDEIIEDELIGLLEGVQPEVVQDKEVVPGDVVQLFEIGAIGFVIEQLREEFGGGSEEDFKSLETSGIAQRGGQE